MERYTEEEIREVLGVYLADWLVDELIKGLRQLRTDSGEDADE